MIPIHDFLPTSCVQLSHDTANLIEYILVASVANELVVHTYV